MNWLVIVQGFVFGLVSGVNYAIFATGLTLVFGIMFVVNMAHGELFMLGAAGVWILMSYLNMNYYLAGVIAVILVAAFGLALNRVAIRPLLGRAAPWVILISTLGVSNILLQGTIAIIGRRGLSLMTPLVGYINLGALTIAKDKIMLVVVGLIAMMVLFIFLKRARLGKDMRATIQSPIGASLCGINLQRVYASTLVLAAAMAALGGVLMVPLYTADPLVGQSMLLKGMAIVVTAGMGNLVGASILGVAFGIVESMFGVFVSPYYEDSLIYGIMILVLLIRPQGLFTRRAK